jgi:RNA polymerase primary sigma factor
MVNRYINEYDSSILSNYFKDIKHSEPLSPEEEIDLAIKIKEGDEDAVERLVLSNLRFVISIAKDYQNQGIPLSDLINEGNMGLIRAAYKFDHTKGFKFISYAVWWVKQSILQFINDNSRLIRLPTNVINKVSSIKKEQNDFQLLNDGEFVEGYEDLDMELSAYHNNNCTSIHKTINEEGDELVDILGYEEEEDYYEVTDHLKEELNNALSLLEDRERDIIECYYGINTDHEAMTLEGIGDKYGITKERVRQVKERAIKKLRNSAYNLYKVLNE